MAYNYKQGFFHPKNPHKYLGDVSKIIFRSGLEEKVFKKFDINPNVICWGSEEFSIKYPLIHLDKYGNKETKIHRYFPDVYARVKQANGIEKKFLIEIKPHSQCFKPIMKKNKKTFLNECLAYEKNQAKWEYAKRFCEEKGLTFIIITEKNINKI